MIERLGIFDEDPTGELRFFVLAAALVYSQPVYKRYPDPSDPIRYVKGPTCTIMVFDEKTQNHDDEVIVQISFDVGDDEEDRAHVVLYKDAVTYEVDTGNGGALAQEVGQQIARQLLADLKLSILPAS